jgi:protein-tyrosine phosphatase
MSLDVILAKERGGTICMGDARAAIEAISQFDLVVFCAEEFQPKRELILRTTSKVRVVYAPFDDGDLSRHELETATHAADAVAGGFHHGRKVLVTCMQGRNRSGLVVALALHMLSGAGGAAAMRMVRARRQAAEGPALANLAFMKLLENIPPRAMPKHGIRLSDASVR